MLNGICAFVVAATLLFAISTGGSAYACGSGDVDGDGFVRLGDALLVLRASHGMETLTPDQICACNVTDVNPFREAGPECNVIDAVVILNRSYGLYP